MYSYFVLSRQASVLVSSLVLVLVTIVCSRIALECDTKGLTKGRHRFTVPSDIEIKKESGNLVGQSLNIFSNPESNPEICLV